MSDATLYDTDYYAWTQAQADALRAHGRGANALDYELLAEEIEDMGRSELASCESLIEQILIQFAKIAYAGQSENGAHWSIEIRAFRLKLKRKMSPSMRPKLEALMPELWEVARLSAMGKLMEAGLACELPEACPWGFAEVLDPGFLPPARLRE